MSPSVPRSPPIPTVVPPASGPAASPDPIPKREKLAYALGAIVDNGGYATYSHLPAPIYQITLGVNPLLVGMALTIQRVWDAFTDPLVGNWSDNLRSRFGRRRPFIAVGAISCAVLCPLVWSPVISGSETTLFVYFLVTSLAFFFAHTLFSVPYTSLGLELTTDYHERTRLFAWRSFLNPFIAVGMSWLFALTQSSLFSSTEEGIRVCMWVLGGLMLVSGLLPAFLIRERFKADPRKPGPKISLKDGALATVRSRPMRLLVAMTLLLTIGVGTFSQLGVYLKIYYVFGGDTKAGAILNGWSATVHSLTALSVVPALVWFSGRVGKRRALQVCMMISFVASIATYVVYSPTHPYLLLIASALTAPSVVGTWMLFPSMLADLCDWDEMESGLRREGTYSAIYSWIIKVASSLTGVFSGLVLTWIGFEHTRGAAQTAQTLEAMRICYATMPALCALGALFLVFRYPISEQKAHEIRAELNRRKALASP